MNTHNNQQWLKVVANILLASVLLVQVPEVVVAAEQDAMYVFKPHCEGRGQEDDWVFGEIPAPAPVADTGGGRCEEFDVENPETLQTDDLAVGDILDIDILIENPSDQVIKRARAWLTYDPNVLEGVSIDLEEVEPYVLATPGEADFDEDSGYAMMELTSEADDQPKDSQMQFARVQFRVKKSTPNGTVIGFHDVQPDGHTFISTDDGGEEANILEDDPGTLHVMIDGSSTMATPSSSSSSVPSSSSRSSAPLQASSSSFNFSFPSFPTNNSASSTPMGGTDRFCNTHADCGADLCIAGVCQVDPNKLSNGNACTNNSECASNTCTGGICVGAGAQSSTAGNRTAFSLLQVQNLRVTTEGTSVFLAWDELTSSQLKGYNVYYGTTSGRYIQRRTVPASSTSLTLRSLTIGTTYFLAVRAINTLDEESAFSNEVSIVVGDPGSSTAPLDLDTLGPVGGNPLDGNLLGNDVPGETGVPTVLMIIVLLSAGTGTLIASRRQYAIHQK